MSAQPARPSPRPPGRRRVLPNLEARYWCVTVLGAASIAAGWYVAGWRLVGAGVLVAYVLVNAHARRLRDQRDRMLLGRIDHLETRQAERLAQRAARDEGVRAESRERRGLEIEVARLTAEKEGLERECARLRVVAGENYSRGLHDGAPLPLGGRATNEGPMNPRPSLRSVPPLPKAKPVDS